MLVNSTTTCFFVCFYKNPIFSSLENIATEFAWPQFATLRNCFILSGGRWRKRLLTYHILNYTPDLTRPQVQLAMRRWGKWISIHPTSVFSTKYELQSSGLRAKRFNVNWTSTCWMQNLTWQYHIFMKKYIRMKILAYLDLRLILFSRRISK